MKEKFSADAGDVLLLLPGAFSPAGGLEMYDRLLIKGFSDLSAADGNRIEVLILNDRAGDIDGRYADLDRVSIRTFARSKLPFIMSAAWATLRLRPRRIIFGHVNFGPLALILRALAPSVSQWFFTYGIDFWKRLSATRRLALRHAEKIVSISEYTKEQGAKANDLDPAGIEILPCALDPFWDAQSAATQSKRSSRRTILTVARLMKSERYKGVDTVLRALPAVRERVPDVHYVIVGGGDNRDRLIGIAQSLGLGDCVEFKGRVSPSELSDAFAECTLFVMPSQKEGFGIVFLEAARFGKPSIAGDHGGSPEVVSSETGRLVTYGDVTGLAAALIELLSDDVKTASLGRAARERLEREFVYDVFLTRLRQLVKAGDATHPVVRERDAEVEGPDFLIDR